MPEGWVLLADGKLTVGGPCSVALALLHHRWRGSACGDDGIALFERTGEEPEDYGPSPESEGKDPAAVALGRRGGRARAESLSKRRRKEIAKKGAASRWPK
jgi:hypothetical protein